MSFEWEDSIYRKHLFDEADMREINEIYEMSAWVPPHVCSSQPTAKDMFRNIKHMLKTRLHFAENNEFVSKIFPDVSDDELADIGRSKAVAEILNELEKTAQDPDLETKAKHSALAIIKLGNEIPKFLGVSQRGGLDTEQHNRSAGWVDCADFIPSHSDSSAADNRADIGLIIGDDANHTHLKRFGDEMAQLQSQIRKQPSTFTGKQGTGEESPVEKELKSQIKDRFRMVRNLFWAQFWAVAEIRGDDNDITLQRSQLQLVTQCLTILQEQLDRLFVIGFTLCKSTLGLFLVDRSGVFTTAEYSDISTPEGRCELLRAVVSLVRGNPEYSGWDTTMKIINSPIYNSSNLFEINENNFVQSYERDFNEWAADSPGQDIWAISMPSASSSDHGHDREFYFLFELLSRPSSFSFSDRGGMAWKAVKLGDRKRKIYIIKQSWRAIEDDTKFEGGERVTSPDGSTDVDASQDMETKSSSSSSSKYAQRNIHEGRMWQLANQSHEVESFEDVRIGQQFVTIASFCRKDVAYLQGDVIVQRPVQNRVLSRTSLCSAGIPITMFATVTELLRFFKDAIQQHKDLYMAGVLHGDISLGNLIICPKFDENTKTYTWENAQGKLIDLDHAKYTQKWKTLTPNDTSASGYKERLERMARALRVTLADEPHFQYLDIESMSERVYAWYVGRAAHEYATLQAMTLSPALELQLDLGRRPDFEPNSLDKKDSHTGTYPFMSCELLSPSNAYAEFRDSKKPVVHHAVHDLESFMACLLYLIITRQGGGGMRREELDDANSQ
ncbi:hypothetical protein CVT25_008059, partial [Psilocybe cyanescens]